MGRVSLPSPYRLLLVGFSRGRLIFKARLVGFTCPFCCCPGGCSGAWEAEPPPVCRHARSWRRTKPGLRHCHGRRAVLWPLHLLRELPALPGSDSPERGKERPWGAGRASAPPLCRGTSPWLEAAKDRGSPSPPRFLLGYQPTHRAVQDFASSLWNLSIAVPPKTTVLGGRLCSPPTSPAKTHLPPPTTLVAAAPTL